MTRSISLYLDYFGLTERPFSLVPDPDFLYWSTAHRHAFAMFEYGILTRSPITLITGEVGAGKTTLLHHLLSTLDSELKIGLISNAHGSRDELLRWILLALGEHASETSSYVSLFGQFEKFLISEYAAGRRVVLVFDEAQNLSRESLEELRMFTNINSNKDELLQLVLIGQPELRGMIRQPGLTQFSQRVAASFHLPALNALSVRGYIDHRMKVAGAQKGFFSSEAAELIFSATAGVPRLINQLCDLALLYVYTDENDEVTGDTIRQILNDGVFFGGGTPDLDMDPKANQMEP